MASERRWRPRLGEAEAEALAYVREVDQSLWAGRFASDQVALDPKNPAARPDPARASHGPVRAAQGRFSAISVFLRKSVLYGASVWRGAQGA